MVGLDVVLQTLPDNEGLLHRFRWLVQFHCAEVKPGIRHCYSQRGEPVHVVRQHQCLVEDILGSDGLSFWHTLIFVLNDVQCLVGMHSHLMTECCGRCQILSAEARLGYSEVLLFFVSSLGCFYLPARLVF